MKNQTIGEMINQGADKQEAENAMKLWEMLRPCLKVKKNGRVDTTYGDKTPLRLYRTIGGINLKREDLKMEYENTKKFIASQMNQLKKDDTYGYKIKIYDGFGNSTHYLNISNTEYEKIKELLLKE